MNKRKIEYSNSNKKKNIDEVTQKLYSTSNEWPVYSHPNGGIIKITPWGSIRQFELNGEMITKFEDMAFSDYNFTPAISNTKNLNTMTSNSSLNSSLNSNNVVSQTIQTTQPTYNDLPQTPQSIQSIKLSPSEEAENYVMKGYENDQFQYNHNNNQYTKEPEHYFGMIDDDYEDNEMSL